MLDWQSKDWKTLIQIRGEQSNTFTPPISPLAEPVTPIWKPETRTYPGYTPTEWSRALEASTSALFPQRMAVSPEPLWGSMKRVGGQVSAGLIQASEISSPYLSLAMLPLGMFPVGGKPPKIPKIPLKGVPKAEVGIVFGVDIPSATVSKAKSWLRELLPTIKLPVKQIVVNKKQVERVAPNARAIHSPSAEAIIFRDVKAMENRETFFHELGHSIFQSLSKEQRVAFGKVRLQVPKLLVGSIYQPSVKGDREPRKKLLLVLLAIILHYQSN